MEDQLSLNKYAQIEKHDCKSWLMLQAGIVLILLSLVLSVLVFMVGRSEIDGKKLDCANSENVQEIEVECNFIPQGLLFAFGVMTVWISTFAFGISLILESRKIETPINDNNEVEDTV